MGYVERVCTTAKPTYGSISYTYTELRWGRFNCILFNKVSKSWVGAFKTLHPSTFDIRMAKAPPPVSTRLCVVLLLTLDSFIAFYKIKRLSIKLSSYNSIMHYDIESHLLQYEIDHCLLFYTILYSPTFQHIISIWLILSSLLSIIDTFSNTQHNWWITSMHDSF